MLIKSCLKEEHTNNSHSLKIIPNMLLYFSQFTNNTSLCGWYATDLKMIKVLYLAALKKMD